MRKIIILLESFLITNATLIMCGSDSCKLACTIGAAAYTALICSVPSICIPGGRTVACVSTTVGAGLLTHGCN